MGQFLQKNQLFFMDRSIAALWSAQAFKLSSHGFTFRLVYTNFHTIACTKIVIGAEWTFLIITKLRQRMVKSCSSLVEGGEGSNLPNCQTNLVMALFTLSLLFCKFINTTAYHLGRYEPSSPSSCHALRLN